jgi:DedD protein
MQISGDDFLKNLEIEKEKLRLSEQTALLNQQIKNSVSSTTNSNTQNNEIGDNTNMNEKLDDIIINKEKTNRQKYIVLAFALVLLFLITIIIMRLLSQTPNTNSFSNENLEEDSFKTTNYNQEDKKIDISKDLDINKIEKNEEDLKDNIENNSLDNKNIKEDIFNIDSQDEDIVQQEQINDKKSVIVKTKVIPKKIEQKKKPNITQNTINNNTTQQKTIPTITKTITKTKTNKIISQPTPKNTIKPKGFYVQVGAFTKQVNVSLINQLKKSNLDYISYKMAVKGTIYTKILVGPYKSRIDTLENLNQIKQSTKKSGAFIMEFK